MGLFDKFKKASDKLIDNLKDKTIQTALKESNTISKDSPIISKMKKLQKENEELDAMMKNIKSSAHKLSEIEKEEIKKRKELEEKELRKQLQIELYKKYGEEIGKRIFKKELFVGMTLEMLKDVKGKHSEKVENVTNGKTKVKLYYEKSKNRLGNISYGFEVSIENELVVGWKDRKSKGTKEG